jgi:hypothetical protein
MEPQKRSTGVGMGGSRTLSSQYKGFEAGLSDTSTDVLPVQRERESYICMYVHTHIHTHTHTDTQTDIHTHTQICCSTDTPPHI